MWFELLVNRSRRVADVSGRRRPVALALVAFTLIGSACGQVGDSSEFVVMDQRAAKKAQAAPSLTDAPADVADEAVVVGAGPKIKQAPVLALDDDERLQRRLPRPASVDGADDAKDSPDGTVIALDRAGALDAADTQDTTSATWTDTTGSSTDSTEAAADTTVATDATTSTTEEATTTTTQATTTSTTAATTTTAAAAKQTTTTARATTNTTAKPAAAPAASPSPGIDWTYKGPVEVATVLSEVAYVYRTLPAAAANPAEAGWAYTNKSPFGGAMVLMVTENLGDWLRVSLPERPNGQEGYINVADVALSSTSFRAVVDVSLHQVTVLDGDSIVAQTKAVMGKSATATPTGRFFVNEKLARSNPNGAYGPFILGLSARSEALQTFNGGDAVIGIHGTNKPWLVGSSASNGCIRIPNDIITTLASVVPLGTPVDIVA